MFTQDLGQAFCTSHLIYCPTATPPRSWDLCFYGWVCLGADSIPGLAVNRTEAHQCEETVLALPKFPVWSESWESGGGCQGRARLLKEAQTEGSWSPAAWFLGWAWRPRPCL